MDAFVIEQGFDKQKQEEEALVSGHQRPRDAKTDRDDEENDARPLAFFSILVFDPGRETVWGSAFLGLAF